MKKIVFVLLICATFLHTGFSQVENNPNNSSTSDFSNCLCGGDVEADFISEHPEYGISDVEVLNQILSNYGIDNLSCTDYDNIVGSILDAYVEELFEKYPLEENPFDGQATDPCHTTKRMGGGNFSGLEQLSI